MPLTARKLGDWSKDMAPALAVFLTTIIFSAVYDKSRSFTIWLALSQTALRFLRFAALLCIPLFTLPKIYAFLTLLGNYSTAEAFFFIFKIAVVLYPPLAVFAVLHAYFIRTRAGLFSKSYLRRGAIRQDEK